MATLKDPTLTASFIASHEGFRSTPYYDVNGYAIGYGNHYNLDGSPVTPGQSISQSDAQALMQNQIQNTYAPAIANRIGPAWDNMTPEQQAAYVDAAYNYGPNSPCLSDAVAAAQTGDGNQMAGQLGALSSNPARRADEAALINGTYNGKVSKGGAAANLPANAKGAAPGTGAGCAGGGLGILGAIAGAGLFGGLGLGLNGILGGLTSALGATGITGAMSGALGSLGNVLGGGLAGALGQIAGPLNQLTGGAMQALSSIGSNILPSLTGVLPSSLTNIVGGSVNGAIGGLMGSLSGVLGNSGVSGILPNAIQQFAGGGGLNGVINRVANNMIGGAAFGGASAFMQNIGISSAYGGISNSMIGAVSEAAGLRFGANGPGALGANFANNNGLVSFGMSALSSNIPAAAANMSNLGIFSTANPLRLQQPASVANQIINAGLGKVTGLTNSIVNAGLPVAGIDNPAHDTAVQNILNKVTDQAAIGAVSAQFNIGVPLDNLGQLTDINHMCPDLAATGPSKTFTDLGQHMLSLGITRSKTFQDVGTALSKTDAGIDLNHLSQMSTPMYSGATDKLYQTYGYGGGSIGELTMADFIGTPAGYVHNDTLPYIIDANNKVMATADGQTLNALIVQLQTLLSGGYHVPGSGASGDQPASADSININGTVYTSLDAAVYAMIAAIESQLTVIKNSTDPTIQAALQASEAGHAASCSQILKENHHISNWGIDLFATVSNSPVNAYVFADSLPYHGLQTGYGQIGDYLERVASDNIYGDAIKGAMRMGRNAAALEPLGVNVERFRLPHSQYYRDPAAFYLDAYTGNVPYVPQNLTDQIIPQTPGDTYVELRNQMLINNGYNPAEMLPAQADETYYDLQWANTSPEVRENIGLNILQQAINRNTIVVGDKAYIIGLNGVQNQFATIDQRGLSLTNNDMFVATLFSIINKMLYGNIGTTKYNTPFFTDQMVYGVLEMLAQITPSNIDGLASTLLGSAVLPQFMDKLRTAFNSILNITNTGLDRNINNSWGAAGPDGQK